MDTQFGNPFADRYNITGIPFPQTGNPFQYQGLADTVIQPFKAFLESTSSAYLSHT